MDACTHFLMFIIRPPDIVCRWTYILPRILLSSSFWFFVSYSSRSLDGTQPKPATCSPLTWRPTATVSETALGLSAAQIRSPRRCWVGNAISSGGLKWQYVAIIATFSTYLGIFPQNYVMFIKSNVSHNSPCSCCTSVLYQREAFSEKTFHSKKEEI